MLGNEQWNVPAGGLVPALALSAYSAEEDQARALAAGFQSYLVKPAEPVVLAAMVATLGRGHDQGLHRAC